MKHFASNGSTNSTASNNPFALISKFQAVTHEYRSLRAIKERGEVYDPKKLDKLARNSQELSTILFEEHKGLIGNVIRGFHSWGVDREDLWQSGCDGFLQGLLGYNPNSGFALSSYLTRCIVNAVLNGIRNDGTVSSKTLTKHRARINGVICQLLGRGQAATIEAIFAFMQENFPKEERLSLHQIKKVLTPAAVLPKGWRRTDPNDVPDNTIKHRKENDELEGYVYSPGEPSSTDPVSNAIVSEMELKIRRILTNNNDYMLFMTWYRSGENYAETAAIREIDETKVRSEVKRLQRILRREMASYNPLAA